MNMETTYLYSGKNRELYQSILDEFNNSECLFSRNVLAYLENPPTIPGPFYSKHISECPLCQKRARQYSESLNIIKDAIPEAPVPQEFLTQVRPEIKETLSHLKKRMNEGQKTEKWLTADFMRQGARDLFIGSVASREFLQGLLYAGLSAIILYFVL